jgi:hypothetical protein
MNWTEASRTVRFTSLLAESSVRATIEAGHRQGAVMGSTKSQDNKAIVDRWFTEFWGKSWNPAIVGEVGAPDILLHYLLQAPRRGEVDQTAHELVTARDNEALSGG